MESLGERLALEVTKMIQGQTEDGLFVYYYESSCVDIYENEVSFQSERIIGNEISHRSIQFITKI